MYVFMCMCACVVNISEYDMFATVCMNVHMFGDSMPHDSGVCTSSLGDIHWFGEDSPNHHQNYPQTQKFNEANSLFGQNLHSPLSNQTWLAGKSTIYRWWFQQPNLFFGCSSHVWSSPKSKLSKLWHPSKSLKSSQGLAVEAVHHAWKERVSAQRGVIDTGGDAMMRWDIPERTWSEYL